MYTLHMKTHDLFGTIVWTSQGFGWFPKLQLPHVLPPVGNLPWPILNSAGYQPSLIITHEPEN